MAVIAFLAFWIVLAVAVFLVAMSNGRGPAHASRRPPSLASRRRIALAFGVFFVVTGAVVPAIVIADNINRSDAGRQGIELTASELRGRMLFGQTCNECHTLAVAGTSGKVGPNLDQLQPPKALVLNAILEGRARGNGRMPQELLSGPDAEDVAAFVSRVAGRD